MASLEDLVNSSPGVSDLECKLFPSQTLPPEDAYVPVILKKVSL